MTDELKRPDPLRQRIDVDLAAGRSEYASALVPDVVPTFEQVKQDTMHRLQSKYIKESKRQPEQLVSVNGEHATIAVVDAKTKRIEYISNRFYLTTFTEDKVEKVQIMETFGSPHVTFFGQRARAYEGAGQVLESETTNPIYPSKYRWASGLQEFYDNHLRGSELVRSGKIAQIYIGSYILEGYFLNLMMSSNANDPYKKQFSFSFLVRNQTLINSEELGVLYDIKQQILPGAQQQFNELAEQAQATYAELVELAESEDSLLLTEDNDVILVNRAADGVLSGFNVPLNPNDQSIQDNYLYAVPLEKIKKAQALKEVYLDTIQQLQSLLFKKINEDLLG